MPDSHTNSPDAHLLKEIIPLITDLIQALQTPSPPEETIQQLHSTLTQTLKDTGYASYDLNQLTDINYLYQLQTQIDQEITAQDQEQIGPKSDEAEPKPEQSDPQSTESSSTSSAAIPPITLNPQSIDNRRQSQLKKYLQSHRDQVKNLERLQQLTTLLTSTTIQRLQNLPDITPENAKIITQQRQLISNRIFDMVITHPTLNPTELANLITLTLDTQPLLKQILPQPDNAIPSSPEFETKIEDTISQEDHQSALAEQQAYHQESNTPPTSTDSTILTPTKHLLPTLKQQIQAGQDATQTAEEIVANLGNTPEHRQTVQSYIATATNLGLTHPQATGLEAIINPHHGPSPFQTIVHQKLLNQDLPPSEANDIAATLPSLANLTLLTHGPQTSTQSAQQALEPVLNHTPLSNSQKNQLIADTEVTNAFIAHINSLATNPTQLIGQQLNLQAPEAQQAIQNIRQAIGPYADQLSDSEVVTLGFQLSWFQSPDASTDPNQQYLKLIETMNQHHQSSEQVFKFALLPQNIHNQLKYQSVLSSQSSSQPHYFTTTYRQYLQVSKPTTPKPILQFLRHPLASIRSIFAPASASTTAPVKASGGFSLPRISMPKLGFGGIGSSLRSGLGSLSQNMLPRLFSAGASLLPKASGLLISMFSGASPLILAATAALTIAALIAIGYMLSDSLLGSLPISNTARITSTDGSLGDHDGLGTYSSQHCFNFINFSGQLLQDMEQAADVIADQGCYIDALCQAVNGDINVIYQPNVPNSCGGRAPQAEGNNIYIYNPSNCAGGFSSLYTLAHESGHIFDYNTSFPRQEWERLKPHIVDNTCLPSYRPYGFDAAAAQACEYGVSEDIPETIATYIYGPFSSRYNILPNYPEHTKWARSIFQCSTRPNSPFDYHLATTSTNPDNIIISTAGEAATATPTCTWASNNSSGETLAVATNANFFTSSLNPIGHYGYNNQVNYSSEEMRSDFASFVYQNNRFSIPDTTSIAANTADIELGVSGIPRLVSGGATTNHHLSGVRPRTAIGFNDDQIFLISTTQASGNALTNLLIELGADQAVNLDGGGSTTFCQEGSLVYGNNIPVPVSIGFKSATITSNTATAPPPELTTCGEPTLTEDSGNLKLFLTSTPRSQDTIIAEIQTGLDRHFTGETSKSANPVHAYLLEDCQPGVYGEMYDYMTTRNITGMTIEDNPDFAQEFSHCLPNCIFFRTERAGRSLINLTWHESKHMIQAHNNSNFGLMYWEAGPNSTETSYAAFVEAWADEGPAVGGPLNPCQDYFPGRLRVLRNIMDPNLVEDAGRGIATAYAAMVANYEQLSGTSFAELFPEKLAHNQITEVVPSECQ